MTFGELFEMAYQKTRSSPYYRMTHHVGDPDTEASLAQLRQNIKDHNKTYPDAQKKLYVRGRLGANNPARDKEVKYVGRDGTERSYKRYPSGLPAGRGGDWGRGWSSVDKEDAQRFDVYVKDKMPHEYGEGLKAEKKRMADVMARIRGNQ